MAHTVHPGFTGQKQLINIDRNLYDSKFTTWCHIGAVENLTPPVGGTQLSVVTTDTNFS